LFYLVMLVATSRYGALINIAAFIDNNFFYQNE
jgi:hypothetical protein